MTIPVGTWALPNLNAEHCLRFAQKIHRDMGTSAEPQRKPHHRSLPHSGKASGDNSWKTHWQGLSVWSVLEVSKRTAVGRDCNLQTAAWTGRDSWPLPKRECNRRHAVKCCLSLGQDEPNQNDLGCLHAPSKVPQSSHSPAACFFPPCSSSTGIINVKQAAACCQASETKTTLHFQWNPTSLQNTSWFRVQRWDLFCVSEKKGSLSIWSHT